MTPPSTDSSADGRMLLDLAVSDVRQHVYCPRIPYFTYVVPLARPAE